MTEKWLKRTACTPISYVGPHLKQVLTSLVFSKGQKLNKRNEPYVFLGKIKTYFYFIKMKKGERVYVVHWLFLGHIYLRSISDIARALKTKWKHNNAKMTDLKCRSQKCSKDDAFQQNLHKKETQFWKNTGGLARAGPSHSLFSIIWFCTENKTKKLVLVMKKLWWIQVCGLPLGNLFKIY